MYKVVCLRPEQDFIDAMVNIPPELEMVYIDANEHEAIVAACRDADFILAAKDGKITGEIILNSPKLKLISLTSTGFDHVDIDTARQAGVQVSNNGGANKRCVAQYTIMAAAILLRRALEGDKGIKDGRFQEIRDRMLEEGMYEFTELKFGILGMGRIGTEVAGLAKILGSKILYSDLVRLPEKKAEELNAAYLELPDLLRECDVFSINLPITHNTRGLIGKNQLSLMKPTAILINTGRGAIVDEAALAEAIQNNVIAGAAIDTFEAIPDRNHPFLTMEPAFRERLFLSPHIGGATKQSFKRMLTFALENIMRVCQNGEPLSVVNV